MAAASSTSIVPSKQSNTSKLAGSSNQSISTQNQQPSPSFSSDSFSARRGGVAVASPSSASRTLPLPRNNQGSRKQHKSAKKLSKLVDDDNLAEAANMRTTSRKGRTSITHLMNYTTSNSHQYTYRQQHGQRRPNTRYVTWGQGSGYHAIDKARYVHANYRFIVDPRADYNLQSFDADIHLDWDNVLQILVSAQSQAAACPICLGEPVAPRMAKCGHIFCLPCLIRYMHSDDGVSHIPEKKARFKKCPICHDNVYMSDTRPVRFYIGHEEQPPREGNDVVLRLMMRAVGSTLALPRDGAEVPAASDDVPWHYVAEVMDYARVMKGTEDYVKEQIDNDITALMIQGKEDELMFGEDNNEWTQKAIRSLREAQEKAIGIGGARPSEARSTPTKPIRQTIEYKSEHPVPAMYEIEHATRSGQSLPFNGTPRGPAAVNHATTSSQIAIANVQSPFSNTTNSAAPLKQRIQHYPRPATQTPTEYYFYQALLHYYLSPLDIRILREAFGDFSSFPTAILPRVERVSTGHVVDDELRKRAKYLTHLPYGCEVNFLECDWTDTVPAEILDKFKNDIERRRKRHTEKDVREEKARVAAEKDEEKRYAYLRRRRGEPDFGYESPFSETDFQPLSVPDPSETIDERTREDVTGTSPPWPQQQGSGLESLAAISTSPSTSRTVWGTHVIAPSSPPFVGPPRELEDFGDGWLQDWEKDLLQEEDLVAQAEILSLNTEPAKASVATNGGGKKKKKKITLMSTNVRRGA